VEQQQFQNVPRCVETVCKAVCFEQWNGLSGEAQYDLVNLADPDEDVRREAGASLYNDLSDEDHILSIPCILAALQRGCFPDPAHAVHILGTWGVGTLFDGASEHEWSSASALDSAETSDFKQEIRAALSKGVPYFCELLDDSNSELRQAAVYVLGKCFHDRERLLPLIKQRLEQETNTSMRAELVFAFGNLAQGQLEQADFLMPLLEKERSQAVRIATIAAVVLIMGPNCSEKVLSHFEELTDDPDELFAVYARENDILPATLRMLSDDARYVVISRLVQWLGNGRIDRCKRRSMAYLIAAEVLFPDEYGTAQASVPFFADGTTDRDLTPVQILFLEHMAATADLWPSRDERQRGLCMRHIFELDGFPDTPEELRRMLPNSET
jgi:hypothetical protein